MVQKKKGKTAFQQAPAANRQKEVSAPGTNLHRGNIETFKDTLNKIEQNPVLHERTEHSSSRSFVYFPHTLSEKAPSGKDTKVLVREATTLQAAKELCKVYRRVAVLNFANPLEPGGGVLRGANAQEESLCRAGTLYPCLIGKGAAEYYRYHQVMPHNGTFFLSSDCLVYSPDIFFSRKKFRLIRLVIISNWGFVIQMIGLLLMLLLVLLHISRTNRFPFPRKI